MNGTSDIKIEDHHNHEKDNIKVIRDFDFFVKNAPKIRFMLHNKNVAIKFLQWLKHDFRFDWKMKNFGKNSHH